jgi:heptosyltransferase-1
VGLANATEGSGYEALSRIFHHRSVPVGVRVHGVTRSREVAAVALGYSLAGRNDIDFGLAALPSGPIPDCLPSGSYAMFFHATARAAKQWYADGWVQLADRLAARSMQVLLPWGNLSEYVAARELASRMKNAVVLPKISLMEAVALIRHTTLVIGIDTGLTHIAAALRRPTIELYCDSPRWKTEGFWSPNIVNLGDAGAAPTLAEASAALAELLDTVGVIAVRQTLSEER